VLQDLAVAREEVVRLVELRHADAFPRVPGGFPRVAYFGGVALQHGDVVSVTGDEHRGAQPDHAAATHDDVGHRDSLPPNDLDRNGGEPERSRSAAPGDVLR